jgi:hypothetical protein
MSKEQLTEQQAQVGTAERETATPDQTHGLPPHVYAQVMGLGPGDAPALADLLILYAGLSTRILTVAAPHVGNAAVQRAITIAQNKSEARGRPGALNQGEMHELLDEAPTPAKTQGKPGTLSQAEMHELLDEGPAPAPASARTQGKPGTLSQAEMHELLDEGPAPAPASARTQGKPGTLSQAEMHELLDEGPASTAEPAWVGGARKYNEAHAELVSDFNELTKQACIDASGQLDPQAVARWQGNHGVAPDGRVGPRTLAAARKAQAKAGPTDAASDQRIPV